MKKLKVFTPCRFSHLLLTFNGSVNFLIYCYLNTSFKAELRKIFMKFSCQKKEVNKQIKVHINKVQPIIDNLTILLGRICSELRNETIGIKIECVNEFWKYYKLKPKKLSNSTSKLTSNLKFGFGVTLKSKSPPPTHPPPP